MSNKDFKEAVRRTCEETKLELKAKAVVKKELNDVKLRKADSVLRIVRAELDLEQRLINKKMEPTSGCLFDFKEYAESSQIGESIIKACKSSRFEQRTNLNPLPLAKKSRWCEIYEFSKMNSSITNGVKNLSLDELLKVVQKNGQDFVANGEIGVRYYRMKRIDPAIKYLKRAVKGSSGGGLLLAKCHHALFEILLEIGYDSEDQLEDSRYLQEASIHIKAWLELNDWGKDALIEILKTTRPILVKCGPTSSAFKHKIYLNGRIDDLSTIYLTVLGKLCNAKSLKPGLIDLVLREYGNMLVQKCDYSEAVDVFSKLSTPIVHQLPIKKPALLQHPLDHSFDKYDKISTSKDRKVRRLGLENRIRLTAMERDKEYLNHAYFTSESKRFMKESFGVSKPLSSLKLMTFETGDVLDPDLANEEDEQLLFRENAEAMVIADMESAEIKKIFAKMREAQSLQNFDPNELISIGTWQY